MSQTEEDLTLDGVVLVSGQFPDVTASRPKMDPPRDEDASSGQVQERRQADAGSASELDLQRKRVKNEIRLARLNWNQITESIRSYDQDITEARRGAIEAALDNARSQWSTGWEQHLDELTDKFGRQEDLAPIKVNFRQWIREQDAAIAAWLANAQRKLEGKAPRAPAQQQQSSPTALGPADGGTSALHVQTPAAALSDAKLISSSVAPPRLDRPCLGSCSGSEVDR